MLYMYRGVGGTRLRGTVLTLDLHGHLDLSVFMLVVHISSTDSRRGP